MKLTGAELKRHLFKTCGGDKRKLHEHTTLKGARSIRSKCHGPSVDATLDGETSGSSIKTSFFTNQPVKSEATKKRDENPLVRIVIDSTVEEFTDECFSIRSKAAEHRHYLDNDGL